MKKFKAWDKEKRMWLFNEEPFSLIGEVTMFDLLKQYTIKDFDNLLIVQYTKLNDNLKNELYEGDLVFIEEHYEGDILYRRFVGKIEYDDGCYMIKSLDSDHMIELNSMNIYNFYIKKIW